MKQSGYSYTTPECLVQTCRLWRHGTFVATSGLNRS